MSPKTAAALRLAEVAHRGQIRKYTGEPYIVHPIAVANLVHSVGGDEDMVCAAYLHDVVEDNPAFTTADIRRQFGEPVAALVAWLTSTSKSMCPYLNREKRKELDLLRLSSAPAGAQTIKLADIIDNVPSIIEHDPEFAVVYLREKFSLVHALTKGSPELYRRAAKIVNDYYKNKNQESNATGHTGLRDILGC